MKDMKKVVIKDLIPNTGAIWIYEYEKDKKIPITISTSNLSVENVVEEKREILQQLIQYN